MNIVQYQQQYSYKRYSFTYVSYLFTSDYEDYYFTIILLWVFEFIQCPWTIVGNLAHQILICNLRLDKIITYSI